MCKIKYLAGCIKKGDMPIIVQAIQILQEYERYRVTLRQLFYQFVARMFLPNKSNMYKKMCTAIKNGRMEGLIDWDMIEDRTRFLRSRPRWSDPSDILNSCAHQFHTDFWENQKYRTEVWIEKDALIGVIEETCNYWDVPIFSCRGYSSTSELHEAALRIKRCREKGQGFRILYTGDHDPSGLNMGDSMIRKLKEFGADCEFERIALNKAQIKQFNLPPNPVKSSDTRSKKYSKLHGNECWELDALSPQALNDIVESAVIESIGDMDAFECRRQAAVDGRVKLAVLADNFDVSHKLLESHLSHMRYR